MTMGPVQAPPQRSGPAAHAVHESCMSGDVKGTGTAQRWPGISRSSGTAARKQKCHAQVVKQRGESMAAAAKAGSRPHGMLSIIGLGDAALEGICEAARARTGGADTVCRLANYLFPTGRVVSGHKDALAVVR